jgi:hypothetical protein
MPAPVSSLLPRIAPIVPDREAGLLLDRVTSANRLLAIRTLLSMRPGVLPEKMIRRAHQLLQEHHLWDTLKELSAERGLAGEQSGHE